MKKFLPYILILVIIANLFAPFSVVFNQQKGLKIEKNKAGATGIVFFEIKQISNKEDTITLKTSFEIEEPTFALSGYELIETITLKDRSGTEVHKHEFDLLKNGGILTQTTTTKGTILFEGTYTIDNLRPAESYTLYTSFQYIVHASKALSLSDTYEPDPLPPPLRVNTYDPANPDSGLEENFQKFQAGVGALPQCGISPVSNEGTVAGCGVQLLYYMIFIPSSYIFGLAGKFFDATLGYSIQNSSYKSGFVTEGWGIVRDISNLFFIFVLIYAAFGMILSIHSIKSKEIIINTLIIGLLINFSLFAGQILIDTSNILARVFYNSEAIQITVDNTGTPITHGGVNLYDTTSGELPLSAAIINKIDPQALIIHASRTQVSDDVTGNQSSANSSELGVGAYFLVIILAIAVNIIGAFVFLSVGLIFIARVIGLWLALVFAPFAFFSYTVPQMQNIPMIGWKKWWPDILGLCFVAPIFMFFMYLILVFLQKGFVSILEASNGPNFVLSIIIPFAFLMILLLTAKKLAKDFSGKMGQTITGGVTAVGAMALGGAALGAAFVGRKTIGSTSKMIQNDGSREKTLKGDGFKNIKGLNRLNPLAYVKEAGKYATAGVAHGLHRATGGSEMGTTGTRNKSWFQKQDDGFAHSEHASHILNDKTQSEFSHQYGKDVKFKDLKETEQDIVKQEVEKDEMAKYVYGKKFKDLEAPEAKIIKDRYDGRDPRTGVINRARQERAIDDGNGKTIGVGVPGGANPAGGTFGTQTKSDYFAQTAGANKAMGEFIQSLRKGSMDVRNLSQTKAVSKGLFGAAGVGIIAAVASGVRMGLKQGVGIDHGTGQKDFFKDLNHTISTALKGVKINIKSDGGGNDKSAGTGKVESVGH